MSKTLYDKIWEKHIVKKGDKNHPDTLYIDLHLIHEVTSPQAFDGLRMNSRKVRRPNQTLATMDHAIPTNHRHLPFKDSIAQKQVDVLRENCKKHNIKLFDLFSPYQGIVHVIAPELGITQPGQTIVCGDSHTATHGAFGTVSFGIGTSDVEHVLSTQTIKQYKSKTLLINLEGALPLGTTAKDIVLSLIGEYGHDFASGHAIEYRGKVIDELSMEERMTICNMSIEMGAKVGLIAPDETTFNYLKDKEYSPKGERWNEAIAVWKNLYSDKYARFDREIEFYCEKIEPQVTWGTNPSMVASINATIPQIDSFSVSNQETVTKALDYMGLKSGDSL